MMILISVLIGSALIAAPLWSIAISLIRLVPVLEDNAIWPVEPGTTTTINVTGKLRSTTQKKVDTWNVYWDDERVTKVEAAHIGLALEAAKEFRPTGKVLYIEMVR